MIIQYIGQIRLSGTSKKSGKLYDFVQFHYVKDDPSFRGRATAVKNLTPSRVRGLDDLVPNNYYDVECDDEGSFISFKPAKS